MTARVSEDHLKCSLERYKALSRLAGLCDARVHYLQKCIKENEENCGKDLNEDEVSDAEDDIAYFEALATRLRAARSVDWWKEARSREAVEWRRSNHNA